MVSPQIRQGLRLVGWNVVLTLAGMAVLALAGEVYYRLTTPMPFVRTHVPKHFVPNVGMLVKPHAEVRWTNGLDFWTIQRTNRLGFLDRELISPERAAASCHVAMIGDSFVEGREVAIPDKFHVRLEALAARDLPHLDVTTSAFGRGGTGQIHQLPYYDQYARHLHPKLLVLVAVANDFLDNSVILTAFYEGLDPERMPYVTAARDADGTIRLRPPHPDWETFRVRDTSLWVSAARKLKYAQKDVNGTSYFANWLDAKVKIMFRTGIADRLARAEFLSRRFPRWAPLFKESSSGRRPLRLLSYLKFLKETSSPLFQDVVDMTAFGLDQFKARADRDGVALIILTTHTMRTTGVFDWMKALTEARGIPVIDQYGYILHRGGGVKKGSIQDARWPHDRHWNPTGHRWAAEALLEYLKQHPEVCT